MNAGGQCHPEDSCPTFRLDGFAAFHISGSQVAAHADGSGGFPHIGKAEGGGRINVSWTLHSYLPKPHCIGAEAGMEELGGAPESSAYFLARVPEIGTAARCLVAVSPACLCVGETGIVRLLASSYGSVTCPDL